MCSKASVVSVGLRTTKGGEQRQGERSVGGKEWEGGITGGILASQFRESVLCTTLRGPPGQTESIHHIACTYMFVCALCTASLRSVQLCRSQPIWKEQ